MCYESFHEVLRVFSNIIALSGELLTKVGLNKFSLQIGNLLISPIFIGHATRYFFRYSQEVLRVVSKIDNRFAQTTTLTLLCCLLTGYSYL